MTVRNYTKTVLFLALFTISLGGWLLHLRIHPFTQHAFGFVPFIAGLLSIIVVPLLFLSKRTLSFGYVLNGMIAIVGTVTMAHFSLAHPPEGGFTLGNIILKTLFCDILILWSVFFVGKVLFDLEIYGYDPGAVKKGQSWRYPNLGWWGIHLIVISVVYYLGAILWR